MSEESIDIERVKQSVKDRVGKDRFDRVAEGEDFQSHHVNNALREIKQNGLNSAEARSYADKYPNLIPKTLEFLAQLKR